MMNKEQEKQIIWKKIQDKKIEVEQNKKNLENSEKELEDLKNKYLYLSADEDLEIFMDVNFN